MAKPKNAKSTKLMETNMETRDYVVLAIVAVLAFVLGAVLLSSTQVVEKEVVVEKPVITVVEKEVVTTVVQEDPNVELVLNKQFEAYVDGVKANCFEALTEELDDEYFEDLLKELGLDVDKVKDWSVDEDDVEYTILSYDEDEDDEDKADVEAEVKVKYTLREGSTDTMKKYVTVSGVCEYDDGEPEFNLA